MEFVVIARYQARAGAEDRVEAALRAMVEPTRAERTRFDLAPLGADGER
jgi:quinol monooxygenase YgiN